MSPRSQFLIADNYNCSNCLEHFKQAVIDTLKESIKKGEDYISGGYEKICTERGKTPDLKHLEDAKKKLDEKKLLLQEYETLYNAVYIVIRRHESIINELSRIHIGIKEKVLWEGKVPRDMMPTQAEILTEYFESIKKILEPCKLYNKEEIK